MQSTSCYPADFTAMFHLKLQLLKPSILSQRLLVDAPELFVRICKKTRDIPRIININGRKLGGGKLKRGIDCRSGEYRPLPFDIVELRHCALFSQADAPKPKHSRMRCRNCSRSSGVRGSQRSAMRRRKLERPEPRQREPPKRIRHSVRSPSACQK